MPVIGPTGNVESAPWNCQNTSHASQKSADTFIFFRKSHLSPSSALSRHVKYTVSSVKKPSAMGSIQRSLWGRGKGTCQHCQSNGDLHVCSSILFCSVWLESSDK